MEETREQPSRHGRGGNPPGRRRHRYECPKARVSEPVTGHCQGEVLTLRVWRVDAGDGSEDEVVTRS